MTYPHSTTGRNFIGRDLTVDLKTSCAHRVCNMSESGSPGNLVDDFGMESDGENSYGDYCDESGSEYTTLADLDLKSPVSSSGSQRADGKRTGTKSRYKHVPHSEKPPQVVEKRNARERKRVQTVNSAFIKLRKYIPYENRHKRLSKVKTLKKAIEYIHHLQELIEAYDDELPGPATQHPLGGVSMATGQVSMVTNDMSTPGMSGLCPDLPQNPASFGMLLSSGSATTSLDQPFLPSSQSTSFIFTKPAYSTLPQVSSEDYHDLCNYAGSMYDSKTLPSADMTLNSQSALQGFLPSVLADPAPMSASGSLLPPLLQHMPPTS